jgi:serine phosphatase RsbU (regulator of sigma subunit)
MGDIPPRLIVVTERDHRFIELSGAECGIGRAPENMIVVKDDMVSRRHSVIEKTIGGYRVRDLKSFNGTYLNGDRIQDEMLKPWDSVRVGRTRIFYVEPGTAAPAPAGATPEAGAPVPSADAPGDEAGEATMGLTRSMAIPATLEARATVLWNDPVSRAVIEDGVRRERAEVERQIGRRLRDESAPVSTPMAAGFAARARRIGPLDGGGDFYDVLVDDRDPEALLAAVGTVSGQGIAASIAASGARHALRGVLLAGTGEPLDRLARLRDLLGHTLHPGTAISVVIVRVVAGGRVRLAAIGGAGALVLRAARQEVEVVRPVGRRDEPSSRLTALDVTLAPDDRLLLASDGAATLRAPQGGEPFGETRFSEAFRTGGTLPPSESLGRLMDALIAHGGGSADRDATVALLTKA